MNNKGSTSFDTQRDVRARHVRNSHPSIRRAQALWDSAQPIKGTQAETYLRAHHIDFCPAELRYLSFCSIREGASQSAHPAMIAAVRYADALVAVEQTLLRNDGLALADTPHPKRMLGLPVGGLGQWGLRQLKSYGLLRVLSKRPALWSLARVAFPYGLCLAANVMP
jgi:hypothetical protein